MHACALGSLSVLLIYFEIGVDGLFVGILNLVETLAAGLGTKYITCSGTDYELKHYFALLPVLFTHMRSISCSILPGSSLL